MTLSALTAAQRETLRARLAERAAIAEAGSDAPESGAVLDALSRIEQGSYGLCEDCGAPIAFQRLLAQPLAPRCIRCETERDRLRARPGPPAP